MSSDVIFPKPRLTYLNLWPLTLAIIATTASVFIFSSITEPYVNACGKTVGGRKDFILPSLFVLFGLHQFWLAFSHRIIWTDTSVTVRDRAFRSKSAKFMDLSDIEYSDDYTIYEFGDISLKVFNWVKNESCFEKKINSTIREYIPHLGYIPAFKRRHEEAESAGCLICNRLCEPRDVINWTDSSKDAKFSLGQCPNCDTTEGLVWASDGIIVTKEGLTKWNESLISLLSDEEKQKRYDEIQTRQLIAGQKEISLA